MSDVYKEAGVDIEAGEAAAEKIAKLASQTKQAGIISGVGGFAGLFKPDLSSYGDAVLVSATDGVGTKLKIAQALNIHTTVGIDLVAMCVNDILTVGAKPMFFLDYIAIGKVDESKVTGIISGIVDGCKQSECVLLGGETAEHPGVMAEDDYDLAGFTVGIVDKEKIIDGSKIQEGDAVIGIASSGVHSNGFSLIRKILAGSDDLSLESKFEGLNGTLGEELLKPTKIYCGTVSKLIQAVPVSGMAHITGGGITKNLPRVLPAGLSAEIHPGNWKQPAVFDIIQKFSNASDSEMLQTFNMGVGYIIIVSEANEIRTLAELEKLGETAWVIGRITKPKNNNKITYQ